MTHFPQKSPPRSAATPVHGPGATPKQGLLRDLMWGRPVFKAPELRIPRVAFDPLPFQPARVTAAPRRSARSA